MAEQTVICPHCGKKIPLSKALTEQIEADLREAFEAEAEEREEAAKAAFERRLASETTRLEKQIEKQAKLEASEELTGLRKEIADAQRREKATQAGFERRLADEKARLEKQARKAAEESFSTELADLRKQIKDKEKQAAEVEERRAELQRLQHQLAVREKGIETEIQRRTDKVRRKVEDEVAARIEEEYHNRELERQKKLSDARKQVTELKRKLEQSSQQLQGEVVELELEEILARTFPDDEIEPIGKGKSGGDVLQKVCSPSGQYCGTIVWESKNTRAWSNGWLPKLRSDQRRVKAELAVLVSTARPKDGLRFTHIDGIWITEFPLVIGVATALRANLIQVALMRLSSKGKHEKMELLYQYLSSTEFKQRVEAIVEAFRSMQDDLEKERRTTEKNWAKREKQLQMVIQNVSGMYGEFQAIAGPSLPKIRRLELVAPAEAS